MYVCIQTSWPAVNFRKEEDGRFPCVALWTVWFDHQTPIILLHMKPRRISTVQTVASTVEPNRVPHPRNSSYKLKNFLWSKTSSCKFTTHKQIWRARESWNGMSVLLFELSDRKEEGRRRGGGVAARVGKGAAACRRGLGLAGTAAIPVSTAKRPTSSIELKPTSWNLRPSGNPRSRVLQLRTYVFWKNMRLICTYTVRVNFCVAKKTRVRPRP